MDPQVSSPALRGNRYSSPLQHASVLIVDDDLGTRETFGWALSRSGFQVCSASCGAESISAVKSGSFCLLLLDLQLPDMRGTDVVRALRNDGCVVPFVLISAFLTTETTVDAMKLGAITVMEKPVSIDDVLPIVCSATRDPKDSKSGKFPSARISGPVATQFGCHSSPFERPGSAAERWATHALKACHSSNDLRTLEEWAACAGVSYTTLRENCRMIGVAPLDARDFVRVLRVLVLARQHGCQPELLLDIADGRTLDRLLQRAGVHGGSDLRQFSVDHFFRRQRFLPGDHGAVHLLRRIMIDRSPES